jgi:hypothetical protein
LDGNDWDGIYVGRRKGDHLIYAGKVDHGFDKKSSDELRKRLTPRIRKTQPYTKRIAHKGSGWSRSCSPKSSTEPNRVRARCAIPSSEAYGRTFEWTVSIASGNGQTARQRADDPSRHYHTVTSLPPEARHDRAKVNEALHGTRDRRRKFRATSAVTRTTSARRRGHWGRVVNDRKNHVQRNVRIRFVASWSTVPITNAATQQRWTLICGRWSQHWRGTSASASHCPVRLAGALPEERIHGIPIQSERSPSCGPE